MRYVTFPSVLATPGSEMAKHKAACKRMWDGLKNFLNTCAEKFVYPPGCTDAQRQAMWDTRGDKVDLVGREFVAALKVVHPKSTAYYAHFAAAHAGDQFRRHGYFPGFGMDGIEAKHSTSVTKMER